MRKIEKMKILTKNRDGDVFKELDPHTRGGQNLLLYILNSFAPSNGTKKSQILFL